MEGDVKPRKKKKAICSHVHYVSLFSATMPSVELIASQQLHLKQPVFHISNIATVFTVGSCKEKKGNNITKECWRRLFNSAVGLC